MSFSRAFLATAVLAVGSAAPAAARQAPATATATITVRVPVDDAEVTIDGTKTDAQGTSREYVTPGLTPGKTYTYTIQAFMEPNNYTKIWRTRKVSFKAGDQVVVDMREADPAMPDEIKVRYVPTPQSVVEAMFKLGDVKENDVVYDLGCGDGRIVVTAAEKYGVKKAIGFDIDPERVAESRQNVAKAGVGDRVEIKQQDVTKIADFSEASLVMLYMGNDLNLAIRDDLRKTLKKGSRLVSHRFTMGDWKPDRTITVTDAYGEDYKLHLWTIK